jgi:hypothetical protein
MLKLTHPMFTNGCLETQFDLKDKVAPNFPNYPMVKTTRIQNGGCQKEGGEGKRVVAP